MEKVQETLEHKPVSQRTRMTRSCGSLSGQFVALPCSRGYAIACLPMKRMKGRWPSAPNRTTV
jgi:hypothetical protein